MQGSRTAELMRPVRSRTLGRAGERDSLGVWSPPSRSLGAVQPQIWASFPHLSWGALTMAKEDPTLHLLCERQSSPVVAALLMQMLCFSLGQTTDAEKPDETMNRRNKKSYKKLEGGNSRYNLCVMYQTQQSNGAAPLPSAWCRSRITEGTFTYIRQQSRNTREEEKEKGCQ